jgi:hypothetical protein
MTFPQPTRRERYPKPRYGLHGDSVTHPKTRVVFDVEFSIESRGCPSNGWDEPGEAPEITIWSVTLPGFEPELMHVMHPYDLQYLEEQICDSIAQGDWEDDPDW